MFLCQPCIGEESGEVSISPSIKKESSQQNQPSDIQGRSLNTIMIKRSKYEKYVQDFIKAPFVDP